MTLLRLLAIALCAGILLWGVSPALASDLKPIERLIESGHYSDAKEDLWEIVYKNKSNVEAWALLADVYRHQNRDEKAVELYEKAVALDPAHVAARLNMGLSLLKLKRRGDAIAVIRSVVDESPKNAMAQYYLGLAYNANQDVTYAFEQYNILKRLDTKLAAQLYDIIFLR